MQGHVSQETKQAAAATQRGSVQTVAGASSHLLTFFPGGGVPEGRVYSRGLVFVSVRTIKRHHHHHSTCPPLSPSAYVNSFIIGTVNLPGCTGLRPQHQPRPQQNGMLSHPQDLNSLLRIAQSQCATPIVRRQLTRIFPLSPPSSGITRPLFNCQNLHPHARRSFASSFSMHSTGPPGDRSALTMPLECHRNATRTRSLFDVRLCTKA